MKRISSLQLVPGMVVAKDVYGPNDKIILEKNTVLTDLLIIKLDLYGILSIYIEEASDKATAFVRPNYKESYNERIRNSEEFKKFRKNYNIQVENLKDTLNNVITRNAPLNVDELLEHSLQIAADVNGHVHLLDMLHNMREYDDSTFSHCLNVGLICYIFANWLKLSQEEVELATACGLLHDIGKLLISIDIIQKPGKLTEEEFHEMQKHPAAGYKLLVSQHVDENIFNAALMHHERCDGSGYPFKLKENQINRYAKIVAIADVYDAMTSARVYRDALCPFKVIEIFEEEGFRKYDVNYILTFLENVVNSYIRNRCLLSDGREGDIIFINKHKLARPIVQCGTEYVDLSATPDLFIECLL